MWRGLMSITSLLTELVALTRESNALTRELLAAMGRPARTPPSVYSAMPPPRPPAERIRTDKDITRVTREMIQQQAVEEMRKQFPHVPTTPSAPPTTSPPPSGPDPTASATVAPKTGS